MYMMCRLVLVSRWDTFFPSSTEMVLLDTKVFSLTVIQGHKTWFGEG